MSQGQRRPQQQHLNMRVKTEQGLSQPSSPASHQQNGKASHHQTNGIEGIQTGKNLGMAFCEQLPLFESNRGCTLIWKNATVDSQFLSSRW